MTSEMPTTTFFIDTPLDYTRLREHFKLIRYEVPLAFDYHPDKKNKYRRLHVQLRSHLRQPYLFFTHDKGGTSRFAVYALYRADELIHEVRIDFLARGQPLTHAEASFTDLPVHLVVKLVQAYYFASSD